MNNFERQCNKYCKVGLIRDLLIQKSKRIFGFLLLALYCGHLNGQQAPDYDFAPKMDNLAYAVQQGPIVLIDEAHHNFHTLETRYYAFAKILRRDGYRVKAGRQLFSRKSLKEVQILVIANALHISNEKKWHKPTPSAFTKKEIRVINRWVRKGGALLLIADHMPMPGANEKLAASFGFQLYNGFATDTTQGPFPGPKKELDIFRKADGTLAQHEITAGKYPNESIDHVATFTGQAFKIPSEATSLLTFNEKYQILLPDTAWQFNKATPRFRIKGFSQGAVMDYDKGRVAIFGEAAMFSAQLKGKNKIPFGLSSPDADQNTLFLRNVMHWLSKLRDKPTYLPKYPTL